MLKTNSKAARENVRRYILDHFDPCGYDEWTGDGSDFQTVARFIWSTCQLEKRFERVQGFQMFLDWCQGLPSVLDTCYFYNRSAIADLSVILGETEEESKKYAESDAERLLTLLIWREIERGCKQ